MRRSLVSLLACPSCQASLTLSQDALSQGDEVTIGTLTCTGCAAEYQIQRGIPRLLPAKLLDPQKDEMKARDEQVKQYDSNAFLNVFGKVEIPKTLKALEPKGQDRILEAGCGTGRMTRILAREVSELVSVDFSFESLIVNQDKLVKAGVRNVQLIQADICNLPLQKSLFDRSVSCQVLEHVPGVTAKRQAVESISRVTQAGGVVVISAYQHLPGMGAKEGRHDGGIPFFRFTREEFQDLLSSSLVVEKISGSLGYLFLGRCRTQIEIPSTSIPGEHIKSETLGASE